MAISRTLTRPMLSAIFFVGSWQALKNPHLVAEKARRVTDRILPKARELGIPLPAEPEGLVRLNAATQLLAATGLATGRAPRLSAAVLAATLVPTTVAGHAFWHEQDPTAKAQQKLHFAKNTSLIGGLLIAAGDTAGRPGVAWRVRRGARDTRRQARHLARETALEAKLAARSLR